MKTADDRHFRVEREEREKEESFPPHPLYKEQKEQRREFSVSAASRENFRQECLKYVGMGPKEETTAAEDCEFPHGKALHLTDKFGQMQTNSDNTLANCCTFASRKGNSLCRPKSQPDTRQGKPNTDTAKPSTDTAKPSTECLPA